MHTPNRCFQTKKILENSNKKNSLPAASGSIISPPIIAQSTNNFALENNLQWCPDLSGSKLPKEFTCAMLAHGKQTTFMSKITYAMLYRPCWDNIA